MPVGSGLTGLMSRRGSRPQGRRPVKRADAGTTNSGGEPRTREDEPVFFNETGAGIARKTTTVRQKWRGIGG
jgi:hypothetical protein